MSQKIAIIIFIISIVIVLAGLAICGVSLYYSYLDFKAQMDQFGVYNKQLDVLPIEDQIVQSICSIVGVGAFFIGSLGIAVSGAIWPARR